MKKIIKYLILLFLLIPFINLKASTFKINKYYVNSEAEIAGGLKVKELIEIEGNFETYSRTFDLMRYTNDYVQSKEGLLGSKIYNPTSIDGLKVGIYISDSELTFNSFMEEDFESHIEYLNLLEDDKSEEGYYLESEKEEKKYSINVNYKNKNKKIVLYVEYVVTNVLVEHKDCAELYYNFLTYTNYNDIKEVIIFVALPFPSETIFKSWAHGNVSAEVKEDAEKRGVIARVLNYKKGNNFDIRIIYDLDLFQININESKKSNLEAISLIESIEKERSINTEKEVVFKRIIIFALCILDILYLIGLVMFISNNKGIIKYKNNKKFKLAYYIIGLVILVSNIVVIFTL